ncbi:integrase catalytic domain-containing protein [Trichonephila clavata]|uniref:Integrase catalytic domain-containing protein n=1 Tax=Trichonephila clavata TaxID=2740835 RepID=A0A8X6KL03_TRICU|nr:integrase catalytic domain-containing protein [Trichonephila clavata]
MANIEALKKSRKNERAVFTKACNRVEELIALEDVDICELEAELNVFKGKVDHFENTHSNILELLPEKDYDAEFDIVEDFRDKAIRIETKARRIINGQQNDNVIIVPEVDGKELISDQLLPKVQANKIIGKLYRECKNFQDYVTNVKSTRLSRAARQKYNTLPDLLSTNNPPVPHNNPLNPPPISCKKQLPKISHQLN